MSWMRCECVRSVATHGAKYYGHTHRLPFVNTHYARDNEFSYTNGSTHMHERTYTSRTTWISAPRIRRHLLVCTSMCSLSRARHKNNSWTCQIWAGRDERAGNNTIVRSADVFWLPHCSVRVELTDAKIRRLQKTSSALSVSRDM